jgi:hypothetical protein
MLYPLSYGDKMLLPRSKPLAVILQQKSVRANLTPVKQQRLIMNGVRLLVRHSHLPKNYQRTKNNAFVNGVA